MDFTFLKKKNTTRKKFTPEEDQQLLQLVEKYGEYNWERIAAMLGNRNARQCHDRWKFYINPNLNKAPFSREEDSLLIQLVMKYGGMWVQISKHFKNRSDVQMKNRWKTLQKQMNLTMPNFDFLTSQSRNSAPYSPCVCEEEQTSESQPNCSVSIPAINQEAKIDDSSTVHPIDKIFGFVNPFFESDLVFFD